VLEDGFFVRCCSSQSTIFLQGITYVTKYPFSCVLRVIVPVLVATCPLSAGAVAIGQIDDFQDGSTLQWMWGRAGGGGPENVDGGPGGAADRFLQNESFGGDDAPGSRMAIFNRDQWTGDFLAKGIDVISLDAVNLGPNFVYQDINLRLAFSSNTALEGGGRVVTDASFLLTRGSGWQHLVFDLDPASLVPLAGSSVTEVMSAVSEMRIISAAQPMFTGEQVIARLGVDNISTVPEPGSAGLLVFGLVAGWGGRRNQAR
jgi:hypothetical protein